jgi:hypothetical protein
LKVEFDPIYFAQEPIRIKASYLDHNLNFDNRAKLNLEIYDNSGTRIEKIPFSATSTSFFTDLISLPADTYTFSVEVENQPITKSGKFKILPFNVEQQFTNARTEFLSRLAVKTNGELYLYDRFDDLTASLIRQNNYKPTLETTYQDRSIIDWKWLLGLIVFFLSLEWFIRKYHGLL